MNQAHVAKLQAILQQLELMQSEHSTEIEEKDEEIQNMQLQIGHLTEALSDAQHECKHVSEQLKSSESQVAELEKAKKHLEKKLKKLQSAVCVLYMECTLALYVWISFIDFIFGYFFHL